MQKRAVGLALIVSLVLLSSVFIVSAFSFSEFFDNLFHGKLTGKVTAATSDGLVAYYKMDDNASSTSVTDSSGNGNTGTSRRTTNSMAASGKIDGALNFNGNGDYVNLGNGLNFGGNSFTVSAWVKSTSIKGRGGTAQNIFVQRTNCGTGNIQLYLEDGYTCGSKPNIDFWNSDSFGANPMTCGTTAPVAGRWYHIVGVYNSTDLILYIDGNKDNSIHTSSNINTAAVSSIIGYDTCGSNYFNGLIDEVKIYNRALSVSEIQQLYSLTTTTTTTPTCTSFTYSNWTTCSITSTQTRTVWTSSPSGCTGGSPLTSQSCNYVPPCIDTDNGINYFVKSNYTGYMAGGVSILGQEMCYYNDTGYKATSCSGSNCMLRESWCQQADSGALIIQANVSCPNGCSNGACINLDSTNRCIASTAKDYYLSSAVIVRNSTANTTLVGSCDGNYYNQVYCTATGNPSWVYSGNYSAWDRYLCPNGCSNGACINQTAPFYALCTIRDAYNSAPDINSPDAQAGYAKYNLGYVNSYSEAMQKCTDSIYNGLMSNYCSINSESAQWGVITFNSTTENWVTTGCASSGCSYHSCPISNCTDSDGGLNYYLKGNLTRNGELYKNSTDYCQSNSVLMEVDCGYENGVVGSGHNQEGGGAYVCPNGCQDGACINQTACIPNIQCTIEPLVCPATGKQTKTCTDVNKCGLQTFAPDETIITCTPGVCSGCKITDKCVPYGYRLVYSGQPSYCDVITGQFIAQQSSVDANGNPAKCQNNYECESNVCSSGECVDVNGFKTFFVKLVCKLSNLFSSPQSYDECVANYS